MNKVLLLLGFSLLFVFSLLVIYSDFSSPAGYWRVDEFDIEAGLSQKITWGSEDYNDSDLEWDGDASFVWNDEAYYEISLSFFSDIPLDGLVEAFAIVENEEGIQFSYPFFSNDSSYSGWATSVYTAIVETGETFIIYVNVPQDTSVTMRLAIEKVHK